MKKIKKSLKYFLISLCAVLIVAAIVVPTVIFAGKQNKQEPDAAFTKEQQILIDSINQTNSQKQEKDSLELVKTNEILNENGSAFSNDEIYAIYKDYFIAFDQTGNKVFYVKSNGSNINVFEKLKLSNSEISSALDLNAIKANDKYLVFSYITKSGDKSYKNYAVADYSNLDDIKILNTITFDVKDTSLYYEDTLISNVKFNLYDDYFDIEFSQNAQTKAYSTQEQKTITKQLLYFYGDDTLKSTIESDQETQENILISPNGNVRVKVFDNYAEFIYKTANGIEIYHYDYEENSEYNFYVQDSGVFVEELSLQSVLNYSDSLLIDGKLYRYSYQFFSTKTKEFSNVELSSGMVKASFSSHDDYLIVFENPRDVMTAANTGYIKILDATGELILSYKATSIESVIKYANNGRFVTCDGLFVSRSDKTAEQIKDFNSQTAPYILLSEHIDNDWFVVRNEENEFSYIMNLSGEIFGDEGYVSIENFGEGYFLTFKNGKVHWCTPSSGQKIEIENYEGIKDIYFLYFGMFLTKNDDGTYNIFNKKNEVIESNVLIDAENRSNFVLVTLTKNLQDSQYLLTLNNGYDENLSFVISNEKNLATDESKTEDENPVEGYADQTATISPGSQEVSFDISSEYGYSNYITDFYKYPKTVIVTLSQTVGMDVYDVLEKQTYRFREDEQEDGSIKYTLVYTPETSSTYNSSKSNSTTLSGTVTFTIGANDKDLTIGSSWSGDIYSISNTSIKFNSSGKNVGDNTTITISFTCQMYSTSVSYNDDPESGYTSGGKITAADGSKQWPYKYAYIYSCSTSEYIGSISTNNPTTSGSNTFQPQTNVEYNLKFHKDSPYYFFSNSIEHSCDGDGDEIKTLKYYDTYERLTQSDFSKTTAHYTLDGWLIDNSNIKYILNEMIAVSYVYGYGGMETGHGVSFDGGSTVHLVPCWMGNKLSIKFRLTTGSSNSSIYVDGNAISLGSDDLLSNGNNGSYIYVYDEFPDISSSKNANINNVAPANLHNVIENIAKSEIPNDKAKSLIYLKNYVFDHWAVCDSSGTIVSYTDYSEPSSTFNSDTDEVVNVVAVYTERTTTALGSITCDNAFWRESKGSTGEISNSINTPAVGFAGISTDDTTVYWANVESPNVWYELTNSTEIRSKSNTVLFKIGLKITSPTQIEPDTEKNQEIIGQFYNFSTISFHNYYTINGTQQENIEFTYENGQWSATANVTNNVQVQGGSNGVVAIFKMNIYGQMTNGKFITFGEFTPSPELDWKNSTDCISDTQEYLNNYTDGIAVYNVTKGGTDIAGAYGYTSTDTSVFNNTHMLVVQPKTRYISYLTPSGSGSESQILTLANYIANFTTVKIANSLTKGTSSTELEQKGGSIKCTNNGNLSPIIYQHNSTGGWSSASGELIKYGGYEYYTFGYTRISNTSGNYSLSVDVYLAHTKIDDGRTLYQQQYAYFIFYNGNVKFSINMDDIDTGELTASENENNGSSQANHTLYTYNNDDSENEENTTNKSKLSYFNYFKITPNNGYLIKTITVTVVPTNATYSTSYKMIYSLKYEPGENETENPVIISDSKFTQLIYIAEDKTEKADGDPNLAQIIQLKISSPGFNIDWEDEDADDEGTVLLAVSNFVDKVKVEYETISYLDVFIAQYKNINVKSYLQCEEWYNSQTVRNNDNEKFYQSDYDTKQGSWFNDTILSQVYLKANEASNIVAQDAAYTTKSNFYYQSNMEYLAKDITDVTINYSKITGYLLSDAYVYLRMSETNQIELSHNEYSDAEKKDNNGIAVGLSDIKTQISEVINNFTKNALEQNTLTVSFFADPITFKVNYGNYTSEYTYDRHANLETYWTSENAADYENENGYYSFVGWVSDETFTKAATDNNPMLIYTDKKYYVSDDATLNELIGSQWQFVRDENRLAEYTTEFSHKDFYVDGGSIISDTGLSDTENYNFWHMANKIGVFNDDNSGVLTLFPVWMANEFVIKFNLNDGNDRDSKNIEGAGTTQALFRMMNGLEEGTSEYTEYIKLNNGFHFALNRGYDENYCFMRLEPVDYADDDCFVYVIVRYSTSEWYFSNHEGDRMVAYQEFFKENGTNLDRYGYSFNGFTFDENLNLINKFTQELVDKDFLNKAGSNVRNLKLIKSYYSYVGQAQSELVNKSNSKYSFYAYGGNGQEFDIDSCYINDTVEGYAGTKIGKVVTTENNNEDKRSIKVNALWTNNDYVVVYETEHSYEHEFVDGDNSNYKINLSKDGLTSKVKFDEEYDVTKTISGIYQYLVNRPYRHGYDFAGWTFAFYNTKGDKNNFSALKGVNDNYKDYWYEQFINSSKESELRSYMGLCETLLKYYNYYKPSGTGYNLSNEITNILYFVDDGIETYEQLGDSDLGKTHKIKLYSNWLPMDIAVDVDLGIPENYYNVVHELIVGIIECNEDDGEKHIYQNGKFIDELENNGLPFDNYGIDTYNYKQNYITYKTKLSNVCFKLTYGQTLGEAVIEMSFISDEGGTVTISCGVADLYVKLSNHNFDDWTVLGYIKSNENDEGTWSEKQKGNILTEKFLDLYPDNYLKASNYGQMSCKILTSNNNYATKTILKDYIFDKTTKLIYEKLYVEVNGTRFYFNNIVKSNVPVASDTLIGYYYAYFDDVNFKFIEEEALYYVYPTDGAYGQYIKDNSKDGTDFETPYITILPTITSSYFENAILVIEWDNMTETKMTRKKVIGIRANWQEIDKNAGASTINFQNGNDGSTGLLKFKELDKKGKEVEREYQIFYVLDEDDNQYMLVYYDEDDALVQLSFKYNDVLLTFDKNYLYYNGFRLLFDDDGIYIEEVSDRGIITKNYDFEVEKFVCERLKYTGQEYAPIDALNYEQNNLDITLLHHFNDKTSQDSNRGLGGIFYVGTKVGDIAVEKTTEYDINKNTNYENIFNFNYGYNEAMLAVLIPFYNGRYLTELSFDYDYVLFSDNSEGDNNNLTNGHIKRFDIIKKRLVFDFYWNSENQIIGINKVSLVLEYNNGETEVLYSIEKGNTGDVEGNEINLTWWTDLSRVKPIRGDDSITEMHYNGIMNFLNYFAPFKLVSNYIDVKEYCDDTTATQSLYYDRKDINQVNFMLIDITRNKNITISTKYAVQTFEVKLFNVLSNDSSKTVDECIYSAYDRDIHIDEHNTFVSSKYYKDDFEDNEYPKFVNIRQDIYDETTVNIPYGYFIYGYYYDSNYVGERPFDIKKDIVTNPYFGYRYIYLNNSYYYGDTKLKVNAKNSDLINSKDPEQEGSYEDDDKYITVGSPMIGSNDKFNQSIRSDYEYTFYDLEGVYLICKNYSLDEVGEIAECKYLNCNRTYYAYYISRQQAVDAGFYIWDQENLIYQQIEDINQDYSYHNFSITTAYYENIYGTLELIDKSNPTNVLYKYNESGVDTKFFIQLFKGKVYKTLTVDQQQNYINYLEKVALTFWYNIYGEAYLDATDITDYSGWQYDSSNGTYYRITGYDDNGLPTKRTESIQNRINDQIGSATLYKITNETTTINNKTYLLYEKVDNDDIAAFDPTKDSADNYVVFYDYFVIYEGDKIYSINVYNEERNGKIYYSPEVEYYVDSVGKHYGNSVKLPTGENGEEVTYYFNYKNQKLYQPNMSNVEADATDFNYKIKTAVNDNYDLQVKYRANGFDIYKIILKSVPDSSIGYWMPSKDYMFWAYITEGEYEKVAGYTGNADAQGDNGLIYSAYVAEFRKLREDEEINEDQYKAAIAELNNKMGGKESEENQDFTFKDLIKSGVIIKNYYLDKDSNLVTAVDLEFSVNLGVFTTINRDLDVNVTVKFNVLKDNTEMTSTFYALQIYNENNFYFENYNEINIEGSNIDYFEQVGNTSYVYDEYNGDIVRLAKLTEEEYKALKNTTDKAKALDELIKQHAANDENIVIDIQDYVNVWKLTLEEYEQILNEEKTLEEIRQEHLNVDDYDDIKSDYVDKVDKDIIDAETGKVIGINYITYESVSAETGSYLVAFYYKANLPEGTDPYVTAVAMK